MKRNLLILFILFFSVHSKAALADITIALEGPLTGNYAVFGEQLRHGATQAVKDINASGGVLGQKIVLKEFDDACDPKQAVAVANQIVSENIKYVIGPYCSGAGLAAEKVYMEEEVLVVSPAVSHPKFTEDADTFIFRVGLRGDLQGQKIASYIVNHFKNQNIAILNDKSAYGVMIAENVKASLNKLGKQEVVYDSYNAGDKDYSAIASMLKQKKIDLAVIGGYHPEIGLIARQLQQQGSSVKIVGPTSLMTNELWSITGKAGDGIMFVFGPDPRTRKESQAAVLAMRQTGFEPEAYTIYAYAAAQVIAQGIAKAGNDKTWDVASSLRSGTYTTVIGNLQFNAKGDVTAPQISIYQWHDGKYSETE
jgi:branched-chain amino acid transport system substrate-binding protein